ncbi:hypothetical protein JQC92_02470 [Shewanella sp. 202IG2-18]|uniref:hypothetical protein n=1 Tax=Parashewanella hymeniacidonis TaxID=2807618 RepID=UPI001960D562|nr:hypothetical protein [Parashewanella hymeniacidonis]MBM7070906.1 hypothetical protein [Parashewanella hymeniacidonis]
MYYLFLIAIVLVWLYFFVFVNRKVNVSSKCAGDTDCALETKIAANAVKQYRMKQLHPDDFDPAAFDKLNDERDVLVEDYLGMVDTVEDEQGTKNVLSFAKFING